MKEYNPKEIESKWQAVWEKEDRFKCLNGTTNNEYILIEFPYPSGKGLHLGHVRPYTALDAIARKKRMEGKNVLFPIGCDAFGLEAERTAIKEHKLPQEIVARNIAVFKDQLKLVGLSFDWSRSISTCDTDYYKWTQWLFLQFVKSGLAEKKETMINWCPECGVLANEEVEDGKCCQCHSQTIQKPKSQWILKMTEYADRLDKDLALTEYLPHIKLSQHNWIGKSEGVQVKFKLECGGEFEIFTTCIETIYGITFMVLAPENPLVKQLKNKIKNWNEVEQYIKETAKKSEFERRELIKEKTGCILEGIFAINPVNNKKVPIYIGDFVLAGYGTGAVMAVPAHDQRDYDFAKERGIEMIEVISGGDITKQAFEKDAYLGKNAKLINSQEFSGLTVEQAKVKITNKLESQGLAKRKLNFKMRDWVFSRQRYWGEPIPMVFCEKCGWVPVPEKDLPVTLPNVDSYEPTQDGESPLSAMTDWVNTTCPHCNGKAKRETDTMPGWAGSSWYFLRYCDPHNDKEFASMDALKQWLPITLYNGGNEHTTRHLLYARFWNKFLFDKGLVPVNEPFKSRISQGLILGKDGKKMSKSAGNGVDPRIIMNQYGADALRLWILFIGDYQSDALWNDEGVKACYKFLCRVWNLQDLLTDGDGYSKNLNYSFNACIKKVSEDMDNIKYNTAISALMILLNDIYSNGTINKFEYKQLLCLLSIFAPHICEEIWTNQNFSPSFKDAVWPKYDTNALVKDNIEIPIQVNGKLKGVVVAPAQANQDEIMELVNASESIKTALEGKEIKKVIYKAGKIFNIVV